MKLPTLLAATTLLLAISITPTNAALGPGGSNHKTKLKPLRTGFKYFQEPGGNDELGHYDARYYNGTQVSYDERTDALHHLIRSYLITFRERNIDTWIAHGTLLGWWWNGRIMPWDRDLDVQVSVSTLTYLAQNLNMTMHNYTSTHADLDGRAEVVVNRTYLLDVNSQIKDRLRGNGLNVIDARWIDVRNGLYIDVTGLSETNPISQPGVWSCKNFHRYRTRDLYPLRETVFEGVPALVPYSFDKVLTEEYSARALTKTLHEGHRWMPEQKEWVIDPEAQKSMAAKKTGSPAKSTAIPHVPRSLQADSKPKAGLKNLLRVL